MKGDPLNPADWLVVVTLDYDRVLRAMRDGGLGAAALWLEQAAEKAMKGWLIGTGWMLVKTHDLERLANECVSRGCDLTWFLPIGRRLKKLYFTDCYIDDSPDAEPDAAEIESIRKRGGATDCLALSASVRSGAHRVTMRRPRQSHPPRPANPPP